MGEQVLPGVLFNAQALEANQKGLGGVSCFIVSVTTTVMLHDKNVPNSVANSNKHLWVCGLARVQLILAGPGWTPGSGLGSGQLHRPSFLHQQLTEAQSSNREWEECRGRVNDLVHLGLLLGCAYCCSVGQSQSPDQAQQQQGRDINSSAIRRVLGVRWQRVRYTILI